jgi:hypothetical protein
LAPLQYEYIERDRKKMMTVAQYVVKVLGQYAFVEVVSASETDTLMFDELKSSQRTRKTREEVHRLSPWRPRRP